MIEVLKVVIGAVIALAATILFEYHRKPRLRFLHVDPEDYQHKPGEEPAERARPLRVKVINSPLWPIFRSWMTRTTAALCAGTITVYNLDGQNKFIRSMPIRWNSTRKPQPLHIYHKNVYWGELRDPQPPVEARVDIPAGDAVLLDVSARFDDDPECYGWCTANYTSTPKWRNPDWRLPSGIYLIKITVFSLGEIHYDFFRLINDGSQADFRLDRTLPVDSKTIGRLK